MVKFQISAPGRIVFCGGDGAMYGKHVVLASLDLRTTLEFAELPVEKGKIIIDLFDIQLKDLEIPLELINNFRSSEHFATFISDHIRFPRILQSFITTNGMWRTHEQRFSLRIFFFLLMHIARYEQLDIKPFRVKVTSQLPIDLNLGSSSSFATCLSACFLYWACLQRDTNYVYNEEDLNKISQYAKLAEKVLQIDAIETDVDVCCHGKMIKFNYVTERDEYSFEKVDTPMMNILLVDLKNKFAKGDRRRQIAEKNSPRSVNFEEYLNKLNDLSVYIYVWLYIIYALSKNDVPYEIYDLEELKKKIKEHQLMLFELGLLDDKFRRLCAMAESMNYVGMIASFENNVAYLLLPSNVLIQNDKFQKLLESSGFIVIGAGVSCVSCKGVHIYNVKI